MQLLVCWPLSGGWGAGEILPFCAQLLWFELYGMKDLQKTGLGLTRGVNPVFL